MLVRGRTAARRSVAPAVAGRSRRRSGSWQADVGVRPLALCALAVEDRDGDALLDPFGVVLESCRAQFAIGLAVTGTFESRTRMQNPVPPVASSRDQ
jgi:hypothetical protein